MNIHLQPYDEFQFYIGCEECEDWFHGRCVGIKKADAERIEEYLCPKCGPGEEWNRRFYQNIFNK